MTSQDDNQRYEHVAIEEDQHHDDALIIPVYGPTTIHQANAMEARRTISNFILMSILFSTNHASVVACLGLATSQLGSAGAWQSSILYLTYTGSAVLGATLAVKKFGSRDSLIWGMLLYFIYTACFSFAIMLRNYAVLSNIAVGLGGALGGIGGGVLWTAEGAYFSSAAEEHSALLVLPLSDSTALFAGIFAFIYLIAEVGLKSLSSILIELFKVPWPVIFLVYTTLTLLSTFMMIFVKRYPWDSAARSGVSALHKATAALQLIRIDPKMKYMIGLNASFGFASAFLNSYVNGDVVNEVLDDPDSTYLGYLTAWLSAVAALMSLVFAPLAQRVGKGPILILGSACFCCVALPFLIFPDVSTWSWRALVMIYTLHGTGRATFEGTLKATFADFFPYEKEGAFANIILMNGMSSAIGYFLSTSLSCPAPSGYCVRFHSDGSLHNVLVLELLTVASGLTGIVGYRIAARMNYSENVRANDGSEQEFVSDPRAELT